MELAGPVTGHDPGAMPPPGTGRFDAGGHRGELRAFVDQEVQLLGAHTDGRDVRLNPQEAVEECRSKWHIKGQDALVEAPLDRQ